MFRSVQMQFAALNAIAFMMIVSLGCGGPYVDKGNVPKVVNDTVEQRVAGAVQLTIHVTDNDDPGFVRVVPADLEDSSFDADRLVAFPYIWEHIEVSEPPKHGAAVVSGLNVVYTSSGYIGVDKFKYKGFVSDTPTGVGMEAGEAEVTVYLLGSDAAIALDDTVTLPPFPSLAIDVLENDRNKKSDTEIIEIVSPPHLGIASIQAPNPTFKILYSVPFGSQASGIDEFTYRISGGSSAKVQVVVNASGSAGFLNTSDKIVKFKINSRLVTDGTFRDNPLALRPSSGDAGYFYKSDSYTITAETDPPQSQPASLTVSQISNLGGSFIYSENPDPNIVYDNPFGP